MINIFIIDSDHHWVSDQKLYAPTTKGGLNCIKLNTFFMALEMNWFKRNIDYKYDSFWTLTLDKLFKTNPPNTISILNYGIEFFTPIIKNSKYDIIESMLQNLQNFLREFVTSPESGDNGFRFQSAFHNTNIRVKGRKKEKCMTPVLWMA